MTKRYFYTDPIKALWMSREFQMYMEEPICYGFIQGQFVIARSPHLDLTAETKYYIHPKSENLLAMMVGDDVELGSALFTVTRKFTNHTGLKVCYFEGDNPNECFVPEHLCKIIQRNGKAFFTPESEEV